MSRTCRTGGSGTRRSPRAWPPRARTSGSCCDSPNRTPRTSRPPPASPSAPQPPSLHLTDRLHYVFRILRFFICTKIFHLWFVKLWLFKDLRVGKNFPQIGHAQPFVSTCFASTCSYRRVLYFVSMVHSEHFHMFPILIILDKTRELMSSKS